MMVPAPKGSPEPSKTPSKLMVCRWFRVDEPGFHSAILSEKVMENQPLAGQSRTSPEQPLVPEEETRLALNWLFPNEDFFRLLAKTRLSRHSPRRNRR
jgi:hypothetical protein